jgi:uncharacterized protein YfaT (DUF1175 family)
MNNNNHECLGSDQDFHRGWKVTISLINQVIIPYLYWRKRDQAMLVRWTLPEILRYLRELPKSPKKGVGLWNHISEWL